MLFILELFNNPVYFAFFMLAIVIAVTVHEFAHSFVAYQLGDDTSYLQGRMNLNPLSHLDPIGTIALLLIGFGWGRPVPVNVNNFRSKYDDIFVSLAGIVANLVIALLFYLPIRLGLVDLNTLLGAFFFLVSLINIYLAAFNLLPIPPLDGSHILSIFLPDSISRIIWSFGPFILIGILLLGSVSGIGILSAILSPIISFFTLITTGNSSINF